MRCRARSSDGWLPPLNTLGELDSTAGPPSSLFAAGHRLSLNLAEWGGAIARSDLDFEAHLDDLSVGHAEIGHRQIGVEVHRGEETFSPNGPAGHLAAG